jgi:hypothetical protein
MGHASITIALECYGHLMPATRTKAVTLVDAYLERATGAQREPRRQSSPVPASGVGLV